VQHVGPQAWESVGQHWLVAALAQKPSLQQVVPQETVSVGQHWPVVGSAHPAAAGQHLLVPQPTWSVGQHRLASILAQNVPEGQQ